MELDPPERPEDPAVRRANLRRVAHLFRPYRGRLAAVLALIVFSAGLGVIPAFLLKEILNTAIPTGDTTLLAYLAGGMILIAIASGVIGVALHDGDEVALIPPVSGGAFRITDQPLDLASVVDEVASADAGAVATFVGTVRRRSRDRDVLYLEYEAFEEMAEPMLSQLAADLTAKHGLSKAAIHHRVGRVEIGEPSVVIAVSAPHRAAALDACHEAIVTLKETIPLWKKEVYAGGEEWIGKGS